jgi:hypothetical protein
MPAASPQYDWGIVVFAVIFVTIFIISLFRVDELLLTPHRKRRAPRNAQALDRDGTAIICDPDGRTWSKAKRTGLPN